jgi:hypothetical protein
MGVAKKPKATGAPRQPGPLVFARSGGDPGDLSPRSHHPAAEAQRRAGLGPVRRDQLDDAVKELASQLDGAAADPKTLAFVSSRRTGQRAALVGQFLSKFGAPPAVVHEIFADDVLAARQRVELWTRAIADIRHGAGALRHQFSGADFLGTWKLAGRSRRCLRRDASRPARRSRIACSGRIAHDADRRER